MYNKVTLERVVRGREEQEQQRKKEKKQTQRVVHESGEIP